MTNSAATPINRHIQVGVFVPPHHPNAENVTLAMRRDFALVEWLEELGFSEYWIGEHHSGGYQIYGSPEIFIAAAAERTSRIRLGAGVISLPYHNPLMVADRIVQLDHQTGGRGMYGFGPGALASDAHMLGIPVAKSRQRLIEGIDVILRLLDGQTVTETTDWYALRDAHLHLEPFTYPRPRLAIASQKTPTGAMIAGQYDMDLLCANAAGATETLQVAQNAAKQNGRVYDRSRLKVLASFHLAETREEARREVEKGFPAFHEYLNVLRPPSADQSTAIGDPIEQIVSARGGIIGTPDDAVQGLETLWEKTGGFGCLLLSGTNWMSFEATKRSYELFMRYVLPKFTGQNRRRESSFAWMKRNALKFSDIRDSAAEEAMNKSKVGNETSMPKKA